MVQLETCHHDGRADDGHEHGDPQIRRERCHHDGEGVGEVAAHLHLRHVAGEQELVDVYGRRELGQVPAEVRLPEGADADVHIAHGNVPDARREAAAVLHVRLRTPVHFCATEAVHVEACTVRAPYRVDEVVDGADVAELVLGILLVCPEVTATVAKDDGPELAPSQRVRRVVLAPRVHVVARPVAVAHPRADERLGWRLAYAQ
mmetsp:Transcript_15968/g.54472  ORF Transcript_15968/g.54472 Transcript_15968/m.54472 type:complete len:204 (-) Transcript_15968:323-934(-)